MFTNSWAAVKCLENHGSNLKEHFHSWALTTHVSLFKDV